MFWGCRRGSFGKELRAWGWSPLNEISVLAKEAPHPPTELPPRLPPFWLLPPARSLSSATWRGSPSELDLAGTLILDFQPPELWLINFFFISHLVYTIFCSSSNGSQHLSPLKFNVFIRKKTENSSIYLTGLIKQLSKIHNTLSTMLSKHSINVIVAASHYSLEPALLFSCPGRHY